MSRVKAYLLSLPNFSLRSFAHTFDLGSHSKVQAMLNSGHVPPEVLTKIAQRNPGLAAHLIELEKQDTREAVGLSAPARGLPAEGIYLGQATREGLFSRLLALIERTRQLQVNRPALITVKKNRTINEIPDLSLYVPTRPPLQLDDWPQALRSELLRANSAALAGAESVKLGEPFLGELEQLADSGNAQLVAIDPAQSIIATFGKEETEMPMIEDNIEFREKCPNMTEALLRICNDVSPIDSISLFEITFVSKGKAVSPPRVHHLASAASEKIDEMPAGFSFETLKQQIARRAEDMRTEDISAIENIETWASAKLKMVFGSLPVWARYEVPPTRVYLIVYADHSTDKDVQFKMAIRREHEALCATLCEEMQIPRT